MRSLNAHPACNVTLPRQAAKKASLAAPWQVPTMWLGTHRGANFFFFCSSGAAGLLTAALNLEIEQVLFSLCAVP